MARERCFQPAAAKNSSPAAYSLSKNAKTSPAVTGHDNMFMRRHLRQVGPDLRGTVSRSLEGYGEYLHARGFFCGRSSDYSEL